MVRIFFSTLNTLKEKLLGVFFSYMFLKLVVALMGDKAGPMHGRNEMLVELKEVEDTRGCMLQWVFFFLPCVCQ